jgi:peptide/nickel transport system substrate-binding protein
LTTTYSSYIPVDEVIANDLAQIGIKLVPHTDTPEQFFSVTAGAKQSLPAVYINCNPGVVDPASFPGEILGEKNVQSGYNFANYAPGNLDVLLQDALLTSDPGTRFADYSKALNILATNVPYVPLYLEDYSFGIVPHYIDPTLTAQWLVDSFELGIKVK